MTLNYKIDKPAGVIFNCLTNAKTFVAVHPVITKMKYLGENKYQVSETLPWGLIPCSFTYPVTIEIHYDSKKVIMKAIVMRLVTIEMAYNIKEENGFSLVEETISFETVLPVKERLMKIFKKQHDRLFKNIEALAI
ncbi:MAG: hypothetical protein V4685_16640 [Bacteroidota bacterium]